MSYSYHWRKALAISFCLHLLLLATAGYLAAGWTAPLPQEVLLEMELVNNPAERAGVSPQPPAPSPVPDVPQPPVPTPAEPIPTETLAEPVVTTSELAMTEAQPVAVPASAPAQSGSTGGSESSAIGGTSGGGSSKRGLAAPGILSKVDPAYPSASRKAGQEGTVLLRIEILANGRTGDISVVQSTGYSALDEAAIAAVGKWQFVPAKDLATDRSVACTTTLPVSFRLR